MQIVGIVEFDGQKDPTGHIPCKPLQNDSEHIGVDVSAAAIDQYPAETTPENVCNPKSPQNLPFGHGSQRKVFELKVILPGFFVPDINVPKGHGRGTPVPFKQ